MKLTPQIIKKRLDSSIDRLVENSRLFVSNPRSDFTRNRIFTIKAVVEVLLKMGGNSLDKELLDYFDFSSEMGTTSAFVQQRDKLLPEGLGYLFNDFTQSFGNLDTYNGYRLLAVDGTGCSIPKNPRHPTTYNTHCDRNEIYAVAFYDICNRIYTDIVLTGIKEKNESSALLQMIHRFQTSEPVLLLGDRAFGTYNNIANLNSKGWKYIFRAKEVSSKTGKLSSANLPIDEEFDLDLKVNLCRSQTKECKKLENYRFLPNTTKFDFLDKKLNNSYQVSFRAVAIKWESGKCVYFITNLSRDEFDKTEIEHLYRDRWSVETSFRDLKYSLGLINFHSKKYNSIKQEIYAKLIIYNFSQFIIQNIEVETTDTEYQYQVKMKTAIYICKENFLKLLNKEPPDIEKLIRKFILPIRNNRHYPREVKIRSRINLIYRIA